MAAHHTKGQVADILEGFVNGTTGRWAWDDFVSIRMADPELDAIRRRCADLYDAAARPHYCGPAGVDEMRRMIQQLRTP